MIISYVSYFQNKYMIILITHQKQQKYEKIRKYKKYIYNI